MPAGESWENEEYRCQLCMQLFASDVAHARTPLLVCENVHNFCAKCCDELYTREVGGCPQCRTALWTDAKPNRGFINVLAKLALPCGACACARLLSCAEAQQHALECTNSHIRCPIHTGVQGLAECRQDVVSSRMWEHCQACHNTDDNRQVHMTVAAEVSAGAPGLLSASLSTDVDLAANKAVFLIVQTQREAYRFCLHLALDGTDTAFLAVRRFFPDTALHTDKLLLALEAGDLCGLVTQLRGTLACHESLLDVLDSTEDSAQARVARVPLPLLAQMAGDAAQVRLIVGVNLQVFFRELHEDSA